MSEEKMTLDTFWNTHKTCGELSYEECDDRFQKLHVELTIKQKEIDSMIEAMQEVLRISDRKHDAWDKVKELIAKMENQND